MSVVSATPSLFDQLSAVSEARSTLDALITGVWRDVRFRGVAECPICGGAMVRDGGRPVAACTGCGAELD